MPRVREYTATAELDPSVGIYAVQAWQRTGEVRAQAARQQWKAAGEVFDAVVTQFDRDDTARLANELPQVQAELNVQWKQQIQEWDGKDPDLSSKFLEAANARFDKISEGINSTKGREYFDKVRANYLADLFEKTNVDQIEATGKRAIQGLETFNNLTTNLVASDPTSLEFQLRNIDATLDAYVKTQGLPADAANALRTKMRADTAVAAARAMADANPEAASAALSGGKFSKYLDANQVASLKDYAERAKENQERDAKAAIVAQKRAQKDDFDNKMASLSGTLFTEDGREQVPSDYFKTLQKLSTHPLADAGAISAARNAASAILRREETGVTSRTDPQTYSDFTKRAGQEPGTDGALSLGEVFQAMADGKLSKKDGAFFQKWVSQGNKDPEARAREKRFKEFLDAFEPALQGSSLTGGKDPAKALRYLEFQQDMRARMMEGVAAGDKVEDLLSPKSPKFIASPDVVGQYRLTQKKANELANEMRTGKGSGFAPPVVPKQPGVTKTPAVSKQPGVTKTPDGGVRINLGPQRKPGESEQDFLRRRAVELPKDKGASLRSSLAGMGGGDEEDLKDIRPIAGPQGGPDELEPDLTGLSDAEADRVISESRAKRLVAGMKGKAPPPPKKPRQEAPNGDTQKPTGSAEKTVAPRQGRPSRKE